MSKWIKSLKATTNNKHHRPAFGYPNADITGRKGLNVPLPFTNRRRIDLPQKSNKEKDEI